VSRDITELFGQLMGAIIDTGIPDVKITTGQLPNGSKLSAFHLPFFFDENDPREAL